MKALRIAAASGAVACLALSMGLTASARDDDRSANSVPPEATTKDFLACTPADEPANFRAFSLGADFKDLAVSEAVRRCDNPREGQIRANYVSFIYGDCTPTPDPGETTIDGGCAPPFEIQSWPACERTRSDYELEKGVPYPREDLESMRGAPTSSFDEGTRLELYTGASTIVIFGDDPKDLALAAQQVAPIDGNSSPSVANAARSEDSTGDLPGPVSGALAGELACG